MIVEIEINEGKYIQVRKNGEKYDVGIFENEEFTVKHPNSSAEDTMRALAFYAQSAYHELNKKNKSLQFLPMRTEDHFLESLRDCNQIIFETKQGYVFSGIVEWQQGRGQNYYIIDDKNEQNHSIYDIVKYCILDEYIED